MPSIKPQLSSKALSNNQKTISSFFAKSPASNRPSRAGHSPPEATRSNDSVSVPEANDLQVSENEEPIVSSASGVKRTTDSPNPTANDTISDTHDKKRRRLSSGHQNGNSSWDSPESLSPLESGLSAPLRKYDNLSSASRTAKYAFSHLPSQISTEDDEDPKSKQRKQKLHRQFITRLGRPDSLAEINKRNEASVDADADALEADSDAEPQPSKNVTSKRSISSRKSGKLTPMEKQVVDIKRKYPDTLMVVEVGYKYRFFGEDARVAAKELSIVCLSGKMRFDEHPSEAHLERFASASIPTHRLHVHVKRLVSAGHKVGVVRQLETAALKAAGDNRNAPFVRQLTNVYTKGTYIDDTEGIDHATEESSGSGPSSTGYLLCITETNAKGWGTDEKVHVGILAVQPATGDIIYDDFEDGFMRSDLETRLLHLAPCEFLIVGTLSKASEKLVKHLSGTKTNAFGDRARLERIDKPKTAAATSYSHISSFYADAVKRRKDSDDVSKDRMLSKVRQLSEHVSVCLSSMIRHLTEYGLQYVFDLTSNFQPFSARSYMLLNGNTLTSLEIYRNQTDQTEKGSLFWVLDRTQTRFGQRLLRKWVGRPLLDKARLEERSNAVSELKNGERTGAVEKLKRLLSKTKTDLEKSLIRIYYQKCTRPELSSVLQTLQQIAQEYAHVKSVSDSGFESGLIGAAIVLIPQILDSIIAYLERINPQAAKNDDKYAFFREECETELIGEHKTSIHKIDEELNAHRKDAAAKVKKKSVDYVTVAGIEYLIEIDNNYVKNVPASWIKVSGTKKVSRFHTPEVVHFIRERDQHREALAAACDSAFVDLLSEISSHYQDFRNCIQSLATLDCLMSLAEVASRPDYCKPEFVEGTRIEVSSGRHPMIEQLLLDSYVPNDIDLSPDDTRVLLITGPNMGGKSSYVRQVALLSIMGQIGSYVPATSARLGMLDAIFTRMGAFDNMMAGESTFMVELSETSDILKQATPRSLLILDELGRGTSTHDGMAIAHAVLDYIVRHTQSLLLFITHYQSLGAIASAPTSGSQMRNMHMRFTESDEADESERLITFLYELGQGVAHRSYGLNVARLANVPDSVVEVAGAKSHELERNMKRARLANLAKSLQEKEQHKVDIEHLISSIEQL